MIIGLVRRSFPFSAAHRSGTAAEAEKARETFFKAMQIAAVDQTNVRQQALRSKPQWKHFCLVDGIFSPGSFVLHNYVSLDIGLRLALLQAVARRAKLDPLDNGPVQWLRWTGVREVLGGGGSSRGASRDWADLPACKVEFPCGEAHERSLLSRLARNLASGVGGS